MAEANRAETIRPIFAAYLANDRKFVENAFSEDFRFTSPYDDAISTSRPISNGAGRTATGSNGTSWSGFSSKAMKPLHPSSRVRGSSMAAGRAASAAVRFLSGDLVAGFWLINTKSLDEAVDWMQRAPFGNGDEIEIRQVFAAEDFGEPSPELREAARRSDLSSRASPVRSHRE